MLTIFPDKIQIPFTLNEFVIDINIGKRINTENLNFNPNIKFDLEVAPDGMTFENGVLTWKTDSSHVEVYDVRLIATDGFVS